MWYLTDLVVVLQNLADDPVTTSIFWKRLAMLSDSLGPSVFYVKHVVS